MYVMGTLPADPRSDAAPVVAEAGVAGFDDFYRREQRPLLRLAYVLTGSRADRGRARARDDAAGAAALAARQCARATVELGASCLDQLGNVVWPAAHDRGTRHVARARAERQYEPTLPADSAALWEAVRGLPRREAQVIALHYAEDMSVDDIAAVLHVPEGTVKSLLRRGRQRLAERLGAEQP